LEAVDATDEKALRASGIQDVDVAVVSIGEHLESSLLVVRRCNKTKTSGRLPVLVRPRAVV